MNANDQKPITLQTRQFGALTIDQDIVLHFPKGILGFGASQRYVVIDAEESHPFQWLLSLDEPELGFPIISSVFVSYEYDLTEEDWRSSGVQPIPGDDLVIYLIVLLGRDLTDTAVNLKAPVVIDTRRRAGYQMVLNAQDYPICAPVLGAEASEAD